MATNSSRAGHVYRDIRAVNTTPLSQDDGDSRSKFKMDSERPSPRHLNNGISRVVGAGRPLPTDPQPEPDFVLSSSFCKLQLQKPSDALSSYQATPRSSDNGISYRPTPPQSKPKPIEPNRVFNTPNSDKATTEFAALQPLTFQNQGLHLLRTSDLHQSVSPAPGNGLLTPGTTPSTCDRRWTPLSTVNSYTTAPSSATSTQPLVDLSPDGFTSSSYTHKGLWNDPASDKRAMPHGYPKQTPQTSSTFSPRDVHTDFETQRQLFPPAQGLNLNTDDEKLLARDRSPGFRPMDALLSMRTQHNPFNFDQPLSPQFLPSFSSRYCGKHVGSNASADHLPPDQNCALWLTSLPPHVTYTELLGSIRHFGRIWCTFINEPDHREHLTAAAKVVFFTPAAASTFLQAAWSVAPLMIQGYTVKVAHNRIKYPEKPFAQGESRVLIVTGHPRFVNEKALTAFFSQRFIYQADRVRVLMTMESRAVVEFSFGSYRCQSQMGMMALEKDRPHGFEKVEYGEDPCEVGDTFSSLEIAAKRIHGLGL